VCDIWQHDGVSTSIIVLSKHSGDVSPENGGVNMCRQSVLSEGICNLMRS
jgi:hypothetical protein